MQVKLLTYVMFLLLASCAAPKNVIYFANAPRDQKQNVTQDYSNKIQKDDLLSIFISSKTPDLAEPFNQYPKSVNSTAAGMEKQGYLVSQQGDIVLPILGRVKVIDLTHAELSLLIEQKLVAEGYINDPVASVKLLNYKISVLGEVNKPGVQNVNTDRVTILEALSMAGDMTIFGKRDQVSIVREENGRREIAYVDVSKSDLFSSPYYYLKPNDVVYVEPNKRRQKQSVNNPALLSTVFSASSLLVTIINFLTR